MKRMEDQSYYEILEVSPTATPKEIQRAYELAKETFDPESLAVYSLFSEREIKEIRAAIDRAYEVLINEDSRKSYDQSHPPMDRTLKEKSLEVQETSKERKPYLPFTEISIDLGEGPYRGTTLKQIRERLGIDFNTISAETKIHPKMLEWIEEENMESLPALVYLKGFLKGYAQFLGLDPQKVVDDYLSAVNVKSRP